MANNGNKNRNKPTKSPSASQVSTASSTAPMVKILNKSKSRKKASPTTKALTGLKAEIVKLVEHNQATQRENSAHQKKLAAQNKQIERVRRFEQSKATEPISSVEQIGLVVQSKDEFTLDTWPSQITTNLPLLPTETGVPIRASRNLLAATEVVKSSLHSFPSNAPPGMPGYSAFKILDMRHCAPGMPLVRIPCEPEVPRALRYERKGTFKFFELPGELRNKIYDLAIKEQHFAIEWICDNHKSKSLTHRLPRVSKNAGHFLKLDREDADQRRSLDQTAKKFKSRLPDEYFAKKTPVAPLLVSKQMHEESSSVFYSKCVFAFHGLHILNCFLDRLLPTAKASITRLVIKYRAYGYPEFKHNQWIKNRHDRSWEDLCWRVTNECTSLSQISLDMVLNKSPVYFCALDDIEASGMGTLWLRPLRAFQYVGIKRIWLRVYCPVKESAVLEVACWEIRKEILGKFWDENIERERDGFGHKKSGKEPRKQAEGTRVITINEKGGVLYG